MLETGTSTAMDWLCYAQCPLHASKSLVPVISSAVSVISCHVYCVVYARSDEEFGSKSGKGTCPALRLCIWNCEHAAATLEDDSTSSLPTFSMQINLDTAYSHWCHVHCVHPGCLLSALLVGCRDSKQCGCSASQLHQITHGS